MIARPYTAPGDIGDAVPALRETSDQEIHPVMPVRSRQAKDAI